MDQEHSTDSREEEQHDTSQGGATADDAPEAAGGDSEAAKAQKAQEEADQAKEEMERLEEEPPEKLEDWPDGKAKYETFGGPEGEHGYHEGPEEQLGPSAVRHHEDGSVSVGGEKVDNPEDYKGEPIPGGPTDPEAPRLRGDKAKPEDASTFDEEESD